MKKELFQFGFLLFFLALSSSCHKDNRSDTDQLIGKWEWIKTINPFFQGGEITPESEGHTITIEFINESNMKEFKDDVLIKTSAYTIEKNPSNPDVSFLNNRSVKTLDFLQNLA